MNSVYREVYFAPLFFFSMNEIINITYH